MRAGKTGGADASAAARPVCGAEGSFAGLTANVPEAVVRQAHQPPIGKTN